MNRIMDGPSLSFGHLPVIPLFPPSSPYGGLRGDKNGFLPLALPQGREGDNKGLIRMAYHSPLGEQGGGLFLQSY